MRRGILHLCSWMLGVFVFTLSGNGWCQPSQVDFSGNGRVEEEDLIDLVEFFRNGDFRADVFVDGRVDRNDILEFLKQWRNSLTDPTDNLVIRVGNSGRPQGKEVDLNNLSVSTVYKQITGTEVSQAFLCFDKMEVKTPGGPAETVFEASPEATSEDALLVDLAVDKGLGQSTAPGALRKVELTGLDPAGQILGGLNLEADRLNWIRLHVVEGFPNSYVVLVNGATEDLEVPSGVFKIIAPGNQVMLSEDSLTELTILFDVDHSIVATGNGRYKLKPVTKLMVTEADLGDASSEFE
ncbi:MAG: DUF4382 domain-containing protein [Candidatus Omnitrophica bacterium]|nr:DUF4382 domain-containing protein [Candidatus Omnitrophota bacterium]